MMIRQIGQEIFAATISIALVACTAVSYDASFGDCTISCSDESGCPSGLSCIEGRCRAPGLTESCAPGQFSSCDGLAATCGPTASDDCCATATTIPGGTFYRSYDVAADGMYPNMSYPATVSSFRLDKYEVTVGRFRKFVDAGMGTQASAPSTGDGARTLNGMAAQGGWDASWNAGLLVDTATLKTSVKCDPTYQTWTDIAGANENLPMNCITWYEAMAFCAWDGGHLPTDAEWNYAASGGSEQRAYPWSSPPSSTTIDCSYANYKINIPPGMHCTNGATGAINRVGSESPKGDGRWGHADLVGNVWQWTLDWYSNQHSNPCDDCADLAPASGRVFHGGGFDGNSAIVRGVNRDIGAPTHRGGYDGVRCARAP